MRFPKKFDFPEFPQARGMFS